MLSEVFNFANVPNPLLSTSNPTYSGLGTRNIKFKTPTTKMIILKIIQVHSQLILKEVIQSVQIRVPHIFPKFTQEDQNPKTTPLPLWGNQFVISETQRGHPTL